MCAPRVRKVKVISTTSDALQMMEVRVISNGINVAIGKPAYQSSDYIRPNGETIQASLAVDGDLSTFSHSNQNADSLAWWSVNLQRNTPVESVLIANRYCTLNPDCLCRLSYAIVQILDDQDNVVAQETLGDTCEDHNIELFWSSLEYCNSTVALSTRAPVTPSTAVSKISPSKS